MGRNPISSVRSISILFFIFMLVVFQSIAYIAYILSPDRLVLSDPRFVLRAMLALATSIGIAIMVLMFAADISRFVDGLVHLELGIVYVLVVLIIIPLMMVLFIGDVRFGARRWLFFFQVSDLVKVLIVVVTVPILGRESEMQNTVVRSPGKAVWVAMLSFVSTIGFAVLATFAGRILWVVLMLISAGLVLVSGIWIEVLVGYVNRAAFLILMAFVSLLTLAEPDIGTAVLFALWAVSMLAVWSERRGVVYLLTFFVVFIGLLLTFAFHPEILSSANVPSVFQHALSRIEAWLSPLSDPYGVTYQAVKDYRAVYLGGLVGHRVLPYDVPPVPWADTIIPFVALYLGSVAEHIVLWILVAFALTLLWWSQRLSTGRKIFVAGYALLLLWQTVISSLSSFNILPQTGMSVPYLSWGRTGLITFTILGAVSLAASLWCKTEPRKGGCQS